MISPEKQAVGELSVLSDDALVEAVQVYHNNMERLIVTAAAAVLRRRLADRDARLLAVEAERDTLKAALREEWWFNHGCNR